MTLCEPTIAHSARIPTPLPTAGNVESASTPVLPTHCNHPPCILHPRLRSVFVFCIRASQKPPSTFAHAKDGFTHDEFDGCKRTHASTSVLYGCPLKRGRGRRLEHFSPPEFSASPPYPLRRKSSVSQCSRLLPPEREGERVRISVASATAIRTPSPFSLVLVCRHRRRCLTNFSLTADTSFTGCRFKAAFANPKASDSCIR